MPGALSTLACVFVSCVSHRIRRTSGDHNLVDATKAFTKSKMWRYYLSIAVSHESLELHPLWGMSRGTHVQLRLVKLTIGSSFETSVSRIL